MIVAILVLLDDTSYTSRDSQLLASTEHMCLCAVICYIASILQ